MIVFICPGCRKRFKVNDKFAGRKTDCPDCKTLFIVPFPPPVAQPAPTEPQRATSPDARWRPGDRVLAHWPHDVSWWYPGRVTAIDGDKIHVSFDDGDKAWLAPDQVDAFAITVGSRVFARWKDGKHFFPGRITALNGEECHIIYDDGDQEWTGIRCIRVDRGRPPSAQSSPAVVAPESSSGTSSGGGFFDALVDICAAISPHCPHCMMELRPGATVCPHCTRDVFRR